jgi:eukaryotic-like serine/threonine-protein kinase
MPLTDPLVLPNDVMVIPVTRLAADLRRRIAADEGDFALTRVRRRSGSKVVNAQAAALLQLFRTPQRVVDVVRRQGQERRLDPERLLNDVFPLIRDCFNSGFLVPAGSKEAEMIQSTLVRGERVGAFEIVRSIQVLEDTELYQARCADGGFAAIKLATRGSSKATRAGLALEARVLRRLDGAGSPDLLATGNHKRLPYLAMRWCSGTAPTVAFAEARRGLWGEDRPALLRLTLAIMDAYARLHAKGVVHGDIQPNNILIDGTGAVTLIDFGCARLSGGPRTPRGGVAFFLEPEQAARVLRDRPPPPATERSDQYSVAALIYSLLTGEHYLDFALEHGAMLEQIASDPPLSFAERGRRPWPAVEKVLARALSKDPGRRYASAGSMAAALRRSTSRSLRAEPVESPGQVDCLERMVKIFVGQCAPDRDPFSRSLEYAPYGSITFGGAGLACALHHIAGITDDPLALSFADCWLNRVESHPGEAAFYNESMDITPAVVGRISPYHTASGVHCLRALLGQAYENRFWISQALGQFVASSKGHCDNLDLTLGRSGVLVACAMLRDAIPPSLGDTEPVSRLGDDILRGIWDVLDRFESPGQCSQLRSLGMAHGWAGVLYATLWWCRASRTPPPSRLEERLDQLAGLAEATGSGASWPVVAADGTAGPAVAGWCNGSAGFIHLWTLAHSQLRSDRYFRLAEQSGWSSWEPVEPLANLCCGAAGRVYGLLNLYRHTGDTAWLTRARLIGLALVEGNLNVQVPVDGMSLYKGTAGVAALAADLLRPETSSMPFFEPQQWPRA